MTVTERRYKDGEQPLIARVGEEAVAMTKLIEDIIAGYLASDDCDTYASDNLLREAEAELRRLRGAVWKASDRLHAYENASADFVDFRVAGAIADLDGALDGEP